MTFYSINFLLFFLAATALVQRSKTVKQQHRVILLANAVFYAYWDVCFLLLLLGVNVKFLKLWNTKRSTNSFYFPN